MEMEKVAPMNVKIKDLDPAALERAASMLKAIAHPMRISIISHLEDGKKLTVTEIHNLLNIEQSTTSHHLGILKDKGVLASLREGKNTYYFLKHNSLRNIIECVSKCSVD
jgi:DNA-binding transcriptional ArsR family regulator